MALSGLRHKVGGGDVALTRSKLQFQSEAAEVFFRAIAIRPIREIPRGIL